MEVLGKWRQQKQRAALERRGLEGRKEPQKAAVGEEIDLLRVKNGQAEVVVDNLPVNMI